MYYQKSKTKINPILKTIPKIKAINIFKNLLGLTGFVGSFAFSITWTFPFGINSFDFSVKSFIIPFIKVNPRSLSISLYEISII